MQERNARELTREGAAENGDIADIDFEGFVDGVAFEGGKAEHYSLTLGSGSFIPGFEDQIVGHSAGEEFDVNVTFPTEYQAAEPVWAIGTGKTATADQADEVNGYIRSVIAQLYGQAAADAFVVQYGGSMNAGNAEELLAKEHVDGGLIGGASLKAKDFSVIVKAASK